MLVIASTGHAPAGFHFPGASSSGMKRLMNRATVRDARPGSSALVELMERVAAGDHAALRSLYDRTSAKLYGVCLRVLDDESDAQDALQDVFVTVWRKARQYDSRKAGTITWLAVLARNKAIDRRRGRKPPADEIDQAFDLADDQPSALEVMEGAEDATRLRRCLDALEDRARMLIRAAFFDGLSYAELAQREDVPLGTMKSWIRRGLLRLRGCLDQ